MEGPGMQQWNKGPRRKTAATSEEGGNIQQDLQKDCRAENRKTNSRVFNWAAGNEWPDIVEGPAPSEMKEETSETKPSEKKKWRYACRLFGMNSRKDETVWHVDLSLGNGCETSNYATNIAK
jgi:hypothetical protein